jgi:hypothetical protein
LIRFLPHPQPHSVHYLPAHQQHTAPIPIDLNISDIGKKIRNPLKYFEGDFILQIKCIKIFPQAFFVCGKMIFLQRFFKILF